MRRKKKLLLITIVSIFFIIAVSLIYKAQRGSHRNIDSLFNQYYQFQKTNPSAAKRTLDIILKEDPNNLKALQELAYWHINHGDVQSALAKLHQARLKHPRDEILALELAKLQIAFNQFKNANAILTPLLKSHNPEISKQAKALREEIPTVIKTPFNLFQLEAFKALSKYRPEEIKPGTIGFISVRDRMLNDFYAYNKVRSKKAWFILSKLLKRYPNDVEILEAASYLAIEHKQYKRALSYLLRLYRITKKPTTALEIGYTFEHLKRYRDAYHYFSKATNTKNLKLKIEAENAITNAAPYRYKILPDPWFASIYFSPIHMSRFNLNLYDLYTRFGAVVNKPYDAELYLFYRRRQDNRSDLSGLVPQIFGENLEIFGIGASFRPFKSIPLRAFVEIGRLHYFVPPEEDDSKWQNDLTAGLVFHQDWGAHPTYVPHLTLSHKWVGDIYADLIYYSRFDSNIISFTQVRQGLRVLEFHTGYVDLYLTGILIFDKNREFFNNIFSWGPGIAIRPSSRYNVIFRLELLTGYYIPVSSPDENPFGPIFHNNVAYMEAEFRF